jgi:hypothetical protein
MIEKQRVSALFNEAQSVPNNQFAQSGSSFGVNEKITNQPPLTTVFE